MTTRINTTIFVRRTLGLLGAGALAVATAPAVAQATGAEGAAEQPAPAAEQQAPATDRQSAERQHVPASEADRAESYRLGLEAGRQADVFGVNYDYDLVQRENVDSAAYADGYADGYFGTGADTAGDEQADDAAQDAGDREGAEINAGVEAVGAENQPITVERERGRTSGLYIRPNPTPERR